MEKNNSIFWLMLNKVMDIMIIFIYGVNRV